MTIGRDPCVGHTIGKQRVRDVPDGGAVGRGTTFFFFYSNVTCQTSSTYGGFLTTAQFLSRTTFLTTLPLRLSAYYVRGHVKHNEDTSQ